MLCSITMCCWLVGRYARHDMSDFNGATPNMLFVQKPFVCHRCAFLTIGLFYLGMYSSMLEGSRKQSAHLMRRCGGWMNWGRKLEMHDLNWGRTVKPQNSKMLSFWPFVIMSLSAFDSQEPFSVCMCHWLSNCSVSEQVMIFLLCCRFRRGQGMWYKHCTCQVSVIPYSTLLFAKETSCVDLTLWVVV